MPANIAFAASKNYPHPDVVRCIEVRRATGWRVGNRALVADAGAVIAFAAGIEQRLWDLMGLARCAGHDRAFFGPEGAAWSPPMSPGDGRDRPFFVAETCEICGGELVLVDLLDNPDATDIWYDEWTCRQPECREYGEVMDAPAWYFRALSGAVAKARKHAVRGVDDDEAFYDLSARRKRLKRTEALESALAAAEDAFAHLLWGERFDGSDFSRLRSTLRRCRAALA